MNTTGNLDPWTGLTGSPTASKIVLWPVCALIVTLRLKVITLDTTAAFVTELITRPVYAKILGNINVKLNKYLYGLRDSPKH
jgi:hypothetical protein